MVKRELNPNDAKADPSLTIQQLISVVLSALYNSILQFSEADESKPAKSEFEVISNVNKLWSSLGKRVFELPYAAKYCNENFCRWLLENGANLNARCETTGATTLHFAALNHNYGVGIVRFILSLQCGCFERDNKGETPLHYALKARNDPVTTLLINKIRCTVQDSLKAGNEVLIEHITVFLNGVVEDGRTLLHLAAEFGDVELCKWLMVKGQNPHVGNCVNYATVLHYAAKNKESGHEIIRYFSSELNYLKDAIDDFVETPLHYALKEENLKAVEALIEIEASLAIKKDDKNYLHYCVMLNKLNSAKLVHELNSDLIKETLDDEMDVFALASMFSENEEVIDWLASVKQNQP
ncbi:putative ankyrin repeat protein RF_0381 [Cloeon dipterum]|uniref:putative ankyrin repeat protein RF_0381 n=1 Tax=Cloeon dipterum TaxID=197152 RepID=UPI00322007BC